VRLGTDDESRGGRTASSHATATSSCAQTIMQFSTPYTPYVSAKKPVWAWALAAGCVAVLSTQVYILKALSDLSVSASRLELMQVSQTEPRAAEPARFLLEGLTPSADQMLRGDCWLFSITGILEDSYRRYGVERGWFDPGSFLRLSRQALGIAFMDECQKQPNSYCPSDYVPGEDGGELIYGNTTEGNGGDDRLLYYMQNVGKIGALPASVCPYSSVPGWAVERQCDGLEAARASNPLEYHVKSAKTLFGLPRSSRAPTRTEPACVLMGRSLPWQHGTTSNESCARRAVPSRSALSWCTRISSCRAKRAPAATSRSARRARLSAPTLAFNAAIMSSGRWSP
jgi:hypothetical protein